MNQQTLDIITSSAYRCVENTTSTTIFREMECDFETSCSPSNMSRANPISEKLEESRVISPVLFCHTEMEHEERQKLTEIGCDWAMDDESSIDLQVIENFPSDCSGKSSSLYSFYFETVSMDENDCDDFSISTQGTDGLLDEDLAFESISKDPASFWEHGISTPTRERSPTQISVGSDNNPAIKCYHG